MAGGFTETAFIKKLAELNNSSQSIQTLSLWLIHHRKHYSTVAKIWIRELIKAKDSKKLIFMYLANDVIQNSKKKGPEYGQEFSLHLKKAFEHMSKCDEKTKNSLDRLLTIWNDRGIYDSLLITEFQRALVLGYEPPNKKPKISDKKRSPTRERRKSETEKIVEHSDGSIETHIQLSPRTPAGDPPEPEELIKAIQDLEINIASSDEIVRERIAKLPREVSEVSLISKIQDKEAAEKLSAQVGEAVHLLSQYNHRLSSEMEHRKKVSVMMRDYLHLQEELLAQAERNLEEYQEKLLKVFNVRTELHNHIRNLPDLTQLPNVTDGLAPLPSAEHLFMQ
ncbi:regulation of nuclear pre-mRNA domain-containing protein 1B [Diorhabda carinulata]|uniref:regulation of nuclear pre-mRNA domain-containing protein 1B n=1 Tax=Diorhabda sublineata TaxID=1163346 RepID=UPI0024E07CD2|nr:regulation of nuclear pre-mRNA domain-containing protein 1B [Diorhabda sublineata]XP_057663779.1 regulation of nuclear pre-mRNA domain-containing protein 1B [Diorhabda carinulata]